MEYEIETDPIKRIQQITADLKSLEKRIEQNTKETLEKYNKMFYDTTRQINTRGS